MNHNNEANLEVKIENLNSLCHLLRDFKQYLINPLSILNR